MTQWAASPASWNLFGKAIEYMTDAVQRQILFWDVLRQRGNGYLEHQERDLPPILVFDHEMIMDGRKLERPANYALLWIKPKPDMPIDPHKRPYVIVDPRAGHGPGIGGSKPDSQVGEAMAAGYPVYFITFFQQPVPGQRLSDVAAVEATFIEEVARRHPEAEGKPCVVGNCQAGWAVAALASVIPEQMGPVMLNGAPLSYWSGANNKNPMRYSGGLLGGKWLESMTCDLGNGLFDGAHLVSNFENLDPANTFWKKYYNLYSKIDTEPARFLGFETWWGGYFFMNREEIDHIVSDLFIGNKLARGQVGTPQKGTLDLRNIRSPIVVFASYGDNITPPQQALNWIEDVYGDEQEIIANDQVIVYLLHESIGHLGIFVSGKVAAKEHKELVGTLEMIDALPAGLYEMIIERKGKDARRADVETGDYLVHFEARKMDDIRALDDSRREEECFQTVDAVSQLNDRFYQTFVSPWVRMFTNPMTAEATRRLHPLRLQHACISDRNPLLGSLPNLAQTVRDNRRPVAADNPFLAMEKMASAAITTALDTYRDVRDGMAETCFNLFYGPVCLGAMFPPQPWVRSTVRKELAAIPAEEFKSGGALAAVLRMVAMAVINKGVFDRRSARIFKVLVARSQFKDAKPSDVREMFKQQARLARQDPDRAIEGLAAMLPTPEIRHLAVEAVRQILMVAPDEIRVEAPLLKKLSQVLDLDLHELANASEGHAASSEPAQA
jgi:hypothetical protein